jgi:hypothetical protein
MSHMNADSWVVIFSEQPPAVFREHRRRVDGDLQLADPPKQNGETSRWVVPEGAISLPLPDGFGTADLPDSAEEVTDGTA